MKIRITTDNMAPTRSRGDVVDLSGADAAPLLQAGYAEAVAVDAPAVKGPPSREEVEGELKALSVYFLRGADLDSLIDLLGRSKAPAKPDPRDGDGDGNVLDGTPAERLKRKPKADHQSEGL